MAVLNYFNTISEKKYNVLKNRVARAGAPSIEKTNKKLGEVYRFASPLELKALQRIIIEHIYTQFIPSKAQEALKYFDAGNLKKFKEQFTADLDGLEDDKKEKALAILGIAHEQYAAASKYAREDLAAQRLVAVAGLLIGILAFLVFSSKISETESKIAGLKDNIKAMETHKLALQFIQDGLADKAFEIMPNLPEKAREFSPMECFFLTRTCDRQIQFDDRNIDRITRRELDPASTNQAAFGLLSVGAVLGFLYTLVNRYTLHQTAKVEDALIDVKESVEKRKIFYDPDVIFGRARP